MINKLYDFCTTKEKISVYTNVNEADKFIYGTILSVDENRIAINMINPNGDDDGIKAFAVNNIFRVENGGLYHKKMEKLLSLDNPPNYNINFIENDIMKSILLFAQSTKHIVSVELCDSGYFDVVGFVSSIDKTDCEVQLIDEYGVNDGNAFISLLDITAVQLCSDDEKRIEKLFK